MRKKSDRVLVAGIADTHAGNYLGLCNPETEIQEEGAEGELSITHPKLTKTQERLWALHLRNVGKLRDLADGCPIVVVQVGDPTDGYKHMVEVMSLDQSNQIEIAISNAAPLLALKNVVRWQSVYGTAAHNGGLGAYDKLIAKRIKAEHPKIDVGTCYHWTPTLNGVKLNVAHHGPGVNRRHWLKGGVVLQYLRSMVYQELWADNEPPALSMFGHVHEPDYQHLDRGDRRYAIDILPSMCGLSEYGRQVTQSTWQITWGWDAFVIEGGRISEPYKWHETLDIRTKEVINYG